MNRMGKWVGKGKLRSVGAVVAELAFVVELSGSEIKE
jgi:hypothetical protein